MIKKISHQLAAVFILFSTVACADFESIIKQDIQSNEESYEELVKVIDNCDFSYDRFIGPKDFPLKLKEVLNNTELEGKVHYIVLNRNPNCDLISFEIISGRYHLMYSACPDANFPLPNTHKEEGMIETWGINKNWLLWKDKDYI